ncbi:hypothetical protein [Pedobacter sp. R-06]|uniref:hypothetical protein n=1 Tax=Pedobacter sp. R-06 TaxID=3404051 RepID=UPI003CF00B4B
MKTRYIKQLTFLLSIPLSAVIAPEAMCQTSKTLPIILNVQDEMEVKALKKGIKKGEQYVVTLSGINTAHHQFKLEAKSFELYSPLPEALKPLLSGLPGSVRSANMDAKAMEADLQVRMQRLIDLKTLADALYENSEHAPLSASLFQSQVKTPLQNIYASGVSPKLLELVSADIYLLNAVAESLQGTVANARRYDPELVKNLAIASARADDLKKNDYLSFARYLIRSEKAKSSITTKPFKSEKDLTELRLILFDSYAKDTLYKATETLYNFGGFGLSFSTGFIYSEAISEKPYYLQARTDGNMAVLHDRPMVSDVSVGAFGQLYYKFTPAVRFGPGIGLSVSPFDGKTRYLAGGGFLLGREKMIGIIGGWAWAKSKLLSDQVKQDAGGLYLPAAATAIPTYERLKSSFFIGLTYNLTSTRK